MISWLRKKAEEASAQLNMWDGGKTAKTVRQARQAQPAVTVRQQAPQQAPSYGRGLAGVVNRARDVVDANTTQDRYKRQLQNRPEVVKTYQDDIRNNLNQVKNAAINAPLSPNKLLNNENGIVDQFRQNNKILGDTAIGKKITSGTLGFRDNFDANTVYDRQRRLAEGKGEWQKPIQASIASATKPMVEPFVKSTQKLGNMIVEGNRIAYNDLPRAIAAQATGNKQAMNNVVNGIDKRLGGQGMFGGGMPSGFNSLDQGSKGFIEDPNKAKSMVATGTEIGTTIAPVGPAATLGVNAFKQPIKQTVKTGTKALLANGVLSGGESAARQYMQNGKIDAKQVATDAGLGATISTALPFAAGVVTKGAPKLTRGIANQTPKIVNKAGQSIDDVFNGVRQAYDGLPNKQGGFVANPLNKGVNPLESLKAEARKYKSAEEFVKAQAKKDYVLEVRKTTVNDIAKVGTYGEAGSAKTSARRKLASDITDKEIEIAQRDQKLFDTNKNKTIEQLQNEITETKKWADENNTSYPRSIQVKEEIIKTKSQLTDIWNKANQVDVPFEWQSKTMQSLSRPGLTIKEVDDPLLQEARKYKSADEFVKAQGTPVYHGTDAIFDEFDLSKAGTQKYSDWGDGIYFDPRKSGADYYRKEAVSKRSPEVQKAYKNYEDTLKRLGTKPMYESIDLGYGTPKYLQAEKARKAYVEAVEKSKSDSTKGRVIEAYLKKDAKVKDVYVSGTPDPTIGKEAAREGYDAVRIHTGPKGDPDTFLDEVLVLNPKAVKTNQQLTDLYNQATKEATPPVVKTAPDDGMQEVIDAAAESIKRGDLDEARMLADTLPEQQSQQLIKQIDTEQANVEKQILNGVQEDLNESAKYASSDSSDAVMKTVADKLAKHLNAPKALYKITGFKRTYRTSQGDITVGGKADAALDNLIFGTDMEGFVKNMKVMGEKFGGTFKEISDYIKATSPDGANYDIFKENLYGQLKQRPSYSRRASGAIQNSDNARVQPGAKSQRNQANIVNNQKRTQGIETNPTIQSIEEAGAKIRPVKQVPEKPPITPPEKPVKTPIDNPPEQFDELPVSHTKKVGLLDKAFRSTRSIIERQGKTGKELSGMLQKQRDVKELYVRDLEKRIPTVQKLKDKEYPNFVDATQGLAKPASAKIEKAVAEWKAIHPEIRDRAVKAGLDVGDLGETYYPHFIDYDKVFKDNNTYNQAINHIVKTGQAESREEAIKLLGYARDISRNRQFGNLEASRIVDIPFYDKSKQSLGVYLQGSADRITKTEIFGKNDEIALKKIANIGVEGGDTEAAKNAFDIAVGAKQYNPTSSKISGAVRKYTTVTRLGLGALTNVSQNVNTGVVTGHMRTLGAVMKQLSPKTRQWAADTGVISDAVLNDLKHGTGYETFGSTKAGKAVNLITAPGFKQVESLNRKIAATAGRDYGLRLAQKGDEKTLRKLGVTGEIKNNTLTDEQQIQVARKVVEKTQFKVDPQDLPGWADTPGGKLVAQFRTFSYNQGKFFSNEVLKPLAKGNVMPLARVLAALPVGYALYETRRVIDGRPEEENNVKKGLASFQKIGGAGLALDIYQQLNPVGSKYLPSDRRVSMATGALGGPTVGTLSNMVGSLSEAIQRKRTPDDESRLDGKIAVGNTGESYTDLTALSRFGLQQIPIVGTPMANRLIPYKKQSDADTGKTSNTATKNPGDGVAKASSSNQLTYDQAINIQKKEYGGKYADYTESEIKELAKTDGEAKQYLSSLEATKKAFGSPKELPEGLHPSAAKVYQTEHRLTDEGKTKWNAKESNDQYIKDTLKNWNNGEEVPVTNEIAKAWAEYEKNRLEGKISNLEMNNEKKKVLRKAYSSVLNQDERGYFGVPDGDIISGLEQGLVTPESLQKALDVDALLVSKGLLSKSGFGKTVWNALGLNAPKSPTAKTTSSRTSRVKSTKVKTSRAKTGGKTAKGGKYNYNLFMFGDAPTKSKSLRDLVNKASAKA